MLKRNIRPQLEKALLRSPVTLILGARQTGKSTLVKEIRDKKNYSYVSFDNIMTLSSAKEDPMTFINKLQKPVIIDEVQRQPELFLAIKHDLEDNRIPGRYLLTGSTNPFLIPKLGDSLVGRVEKINLYPFSQGEINNIEDRFIDNVFQNKIPEIQQTLTKEEIYKKIIIGGFPLVQELDDEARETWMDDYIDIIVQKDIKDLANIEALTQIPNILRILAARASNLLNIADLSRISGIPVTTLRRYLSILNAIFLIDLLPPFSKNLGNRYIKSPKIYLLDSGFLCYLLKINLERALSDNLLMGQVLENFVVTELIKQRTWNISKPDIFHYRTATGIEVDIVLENRMAQIVGIETKASEMVKPEDFKGLKYLQEDVKDKFVKGIILYLGKEILYFGENLIAMPINSLWSV